MANHLPAGQEQVPVDLGRYEIILPIAAGGMATVSLARSRGTGGFERYVAIKLTHSHLAEAEAEAESEAMANLLEEAKLAVRIRHPNIVQTLDVGESGTSLFLVMDYVEGDSLSGLLKRGRKAGVEIPLGMKMRVLADALAGLHAAHELKDDDGQPLGLVHRDVSPQNILVGTDGMARLADFGIARTSSRVTQTRPGSVKGKVAYMPPEQVQGARVDRRCDVWAAGVIAWELIANRRLFELNEQLAVAMQIVNEPIPKLRTASPDASPALEKVIAEALQKDLSLRTPSAAALRSALLEACKWSGISLFDHEQVGEIVERLTRPSLDARHKKAKEILAQRSSRAASLPDIAVDGARASIPGAPPSRREPPISVPGATPSTAGPMLPLPGESTSIAPTQRTDTSAVGDSRPRRLHDRRLKLASIATGSVVVLGAVLLLGRPWTTSETSGKSSAERASALAVTETARVDTLPPTREPIVTMKSAQPTSTIEASAGPSSSASAKTTASGNATGTIKRLPTGKPVVPPLADNPYGPKR